MLLTATVLRVRPHREHDRLYTLYTRERGKLTVLGTGTAKITSKLAGHLGPLLISDVRTVPGRVFEKLTAALVVETFPNVSNSLERLGGAYSLFEQLDALTKEEHADPDLWELLVHALRRLDRGIASSEVVPQFSVRLLSILGERQPLQVHLSRPLFTEPWREWARRQLV